MNHFIKYGIKPPILNVSNTNNALYPPNDIIYVFGIQYYLIYLFGWSKLYAITSPYISAANAVLVSF